MISFSFIGLIIIVIAWLIQLVSMHKSNKINPFFVSGYALGVLFLVYAGFSANMITLAVGNLMSFIVSVFILVLLLKGKKKSFIRTSK
jgi:hypothetical protein